MRLLILLCLSVVTANTATLHVEPFEKIRALVLSGGTVLVKEICQNLTEMHNEMKIGDMAQTNREFLNLAGRYSALEGPNRYIVSNFECRKAIFKPMNRGAKRWMRNFVGSHVGSWYSEGGRFDDVIRWFSPEKNSGVQFVRWMNRCEQKRCDCSKKYTTPFMKDIDCSWGWNYPQDGNPYVYQWNVGEGKHQDETSGYLEAFQMSFDGFYGLLDQAKCLIWVSLNDHCLQCFNGAVNPEKVAIACSKSASFGQYEVKIQTEETESEGSGENTNS